MAEPSDALTANWRTQAHSGVGRPSLTATIRVGRFYRRYANWPGPPIGGRIAGGNNVQPWQAFWTPLSDSVEMPNILSFNKEKDFANNGISIATIEFENIHILEQGADTTLVHVMQRGAFAPYRGYRAPGRPAWPAGSKNLWYRILDRNAQLTFWEGYGDELVKTWTGLIDDVDLNSKPDRITVTARDFGQVLSDQDMFGWNHDPKIREPVTFIDKRQGEDLKKVGYDARAATAAANHPASYVLDTESDTWWRSRTYNTPHATDWIQLRVPLGRYETFYLWPKDAGMSCYISVFVKPRADGKHNLWGDTVLPDNGWVDLGLGDVPGDEGGIPFVKFLPRLDGKGHYHTFSRDAYSLALECGRGSIIRCSFRNLQEQRAGELPAGEPEDLPYAARVIRMVAMQRQLKKAAREKHMVLVDDVSDAVRFLLRWSGFKEWEVENSGVKLAKKVVIDRSMKVIDAINLFKEAVDFVFYMKDPSGDDLSIGIPVFRQSRVVTEDAPVTNISEKDLLTGIRVKITDEPLAYVIRMRGRAVKKKKPGTGFRLGGGDVRRVKFTYYPPWSRAEFGGRLAGQLKHVLHQDDKFATAEDCEFACYYVALHEALESITGTVEVPGWPGFELDDLVMVSDTGTGIRSRLWVSNLSSAHELGEQTSYKMTLSGAWVDTPDVVAIKKVINAKVRSGE